MTQITHGHAISSEQLDRRKADAKSEAERKRRAAPKMKSFHKGWKVTGILPASWRQGDTVEEAEQMARDALVTAMDFYVEQGRPVPAPSKPEKGERSVALPPSVVVKAALLNARLQSGARPVDVARTMGINPQGMTRGFDLQHATKIDTIAAALAAMGYELRMDVVRVS